MKKRIDTSLVTSVKRLPWKAPSIDFIQDDVDGVSNDILKPFIEQSVSAGVNNQASPSLSQGKLLTYDYDTPFLLWGGGYTMSVGSSYGTFSISEGSVYYQEKIYDIPTQEFTFSATSSSFIGASASFTYDPIADPTTFSNLDVEDVHKNYTIIFTHGTGSATSSYDWYYKSGDYTALQNIGKRTDWVDGGTSFTMLGGSYTAGNVSYNRFKIDGNTLTWHIALRSFTITAPAALTIYMPPAIKSVYGKSWYWHSTVTTCIVNAAHTPRYVAGLECYNGGINYVNVVPFNSGTFSNVSGASDIDIYLTGEVF